MDIGGKVTPRDRWAGSSSQDRWTGSVARTIWRGVVAMATHSRRYIRALGANGVAIATSALRRLRRIAPVSGGAASTGAEPRRWRRIASLSAGASVAAA